jgi:hypothetical protein
MWLDTYIREAGPYCQRYLQCKWNLWLHGKSMAWGNVRRLFAAKRNWAVFHSEGSLYPSYNKCNLFKEDEINEACSGPVFEEIWNKWTFWSESFKECKRLEPCYVGSLSPQHGASLGCGWRNGLQIWRLAANILNKQSWTDNKRWPSSLGVGHGVNNPSP